MGSGRASGSKRSRAAVAAGAVTALLALASIGIVLAATRDGEVAVTETTTGAAPELSAAEIYPSLAHRSPPSRPDYAELFVSGRTLVDVATPTCPRYAAVTGTWSRRGRALRSASLGADASPKAAARYYANVVWVSQDERGEFRRAISRISRSRVSAATGGAVKRGFVVNAFTKDALAVCGMTERYRRTYVSLDRIDARIAGIIALARLNSSSGTEVNAAQ